MVQKRVTTEIAKILKKAGYPQDIYDSTIFIEGDVNKMQEALVLPTYIDVWLWLWREKGMMVDVSRVEDCVELSIYTKDLVCLYLDDQVYPAPEEAIIAGINHLVSNKLIK